MDRSIAQALSGLAPTLNDLPPELLELAASLLAQSRSQGSLKAEEEIARSYACANLACERYVHRSMQTIGTYITSLEAQAEPRASQNSTSSPMSPKSVPEALQIP